MSAEDETFDIDLYGDEPDNEDVQLYEQESYTRHNGYDGTQEPQEQAKHTTSNNLQTTTSTSNESQLTASTSNEPQSRTSTSNQPQLTTSTSNQPQLTTSISNEPHLMTSTSNEPQNTTTTSTTTHGVKRKAPDDNHSHLSYKDERPLDQGAQVSLKLTELQWWTTEEDLRYFCAQAHCEDELIEVAFGEHKINGKSKGEAYLEFETPQAAGMVKRKVEKANAELESGGKTIIAGGKTKISVWYTSPGNPFRVREGQGKKETADRGKFSQGAYNNHSNRGGYTGGRGRGHNTRGGQWSNQSTPNFQMGFNPMAYGAFPGMAMNQNAMMSSMMAGGYNMAMGMPMMPGRGGMMGRGGWTGQGAQQGFNAGWDSNKKPRKE